MSKLEEALEKANKIRESQVNTVREKPSEINDSALTKIKSEYIVTHDTADSLIAEEYKKLKSMLIRETKADFLNTIMITSAVESEGKSLTAVNLAISLAQEIDHSILLVDADFRKPMIHEYLGVEYKYGLSDYLSQDIDISDILVKTGIGNLVVLPAGHHVANPVELLASGKMMTLMRELKHRYMDRYIIIDTPPVLPFADTITIGSYVDVIIFIVQEGKAQQSTIEEAIEMIKDFKILGVVYNNVSSTQLDGHYSGYYRYGYNYRKKEKG